MLVACAGRPATPAPPPPVEDGPDAGAKRVHPTAAPQSFTPAMTPRPTTSAIRELFSVDVGATTPQTTMVFADHALVVGTATGISVLDPMKGTLVRRIAVGSVVGIARDDARLFATTSDGAVVSVGLDGSSRFRTPIGGTPTAAPTLVDANGDGTLDVVVGDATGKVVCIDGKTGARQWARSVGGVLSAISLTDADGDGHDELVVGDGRSSLFALRAKDGESVREWRLGAPIAGAPVIVDVDGDGRAEILTTSTHGVLTISSHDGTTLWTARVEEDDGTEVDVVAPALPIPSPRNGVVAAATAGHGERDGMVLVGERLRAFRSHEGSITSAPVVARVESEELASAIVGTSAGVVVAFDALGNRTVLAKVSGPVVASLLVSDVNAEGLLEIVAVTESGKLSAFQTTAPAPALVPRARGASPHNDGKIPPITLPWRFR